MRKFGELSVSLVGYRSEVVGNGTAVVIVFSSRARKFDESSVWVLGDRLVVVCLIVRIIDELAT